jgi:signal transduction histidine kinase
MGDRQGRKSRAFVISLLAGIFVLLAGLYGYRLLLDRSGLPAEIDRKLLVRIDATEITAESDERFALTRKSPGETAAFTLRTPDGGVEKKTLPLVPYFARTLFPPIYLFIGLICIAIGFLTYVLRPDDRKARIYYWLSLAFGTATIISGEEYGLGRSWTTFIPSVLFIAAYAAAPALLLHFSLAFSDGETRPRRLAIFVPPALIAAGQVAAFLAAFLVPSAAIFRAYNAYYPAFRVYVIVYIALAVAVLYRAFRRSQDDEARAQIKWIFYGLAVGMLPYLSLFMAPVAAGAAPLLSEEITTIFFIAIPVAFSVAIVKYRLMNIGLVINRSLVYSLLTVFTVGLYLVFIELAQRLFARSVAGRELGVTIVGVFLAALAFQPAQRRIQTFVDKAFFRQSYDYRQTIMAFNEHAQKTIDRGDLLDFFRREIMRVLPVESFRIGPSAGDAPPEPAGAAGLALPLSVGPGDGPSFLVLGRKRSGSRYTREDVELLRSMSGELQVNLDRLRLQEEVIYERASREKLDELNRLKTEFISTVSHELRTPLSSIQSLAELLQSGKIKDRSKTESYLGLMAAESTRLSRFLHNILDFGKIEQGVKTYHPRPAVLQDVIEEAAAVFLPLVEGRGIIIEVACPATPVRLDIDADAVKQALINLIDNAIKYSGAEKYVAVELADGGATWDIRVKDRGIGISPDDMKRIFDKFFRSVQAGRMCPEGAGLGLKIIRHIMDAHKGDVLVRSTEGEGSVFTLAFPKP